MQIFYNANAENKFPRFLVLQKKRPQKRYAWSINGVWALSQCTM